MVGIVYVASYSKSNEMLIQRTKKHREEDAETVQGCQWPLMAKEGKLEKKDSPR